MRQPAFRDLNARKNPNRMLRSEGGWLQPKQLLMIPARVAIALQNDGWTLRNDIIWYKPNGLPNSVKDRLTNKYEHVFHFVKSRRYYYDLDAIRVPHKRGTARADYDFARMMRGRQCFEGKWSRRGMQRAFVAGNRNGRNPGDVILARDKTALLAKINSTRNPPEPHEPGAFHPLGKNPGDVIEPTRHELALGKPPERWEDSLHTSEYHPLGKNPGDLMTAESDREGDFWSITTKPFPEAHFAVYPEDLCLRPILSSCPRFVCKKCGKPAERRSVVVSRRVTQAMYYAGCNKQGSYSGATWKAYSSSRDQDPSVTKRRILESISRVKRSYLAGCDCNAGFMPGIVFDPFAGAGTTLLVAKKLGLRWLGCDLNPEFVRMAKQRINSA